MCQTFGHNCDEEDVCRFGAQHYHVNQYYAKQPEKSKINAQAYSTANNITKVNQVMNQFPDMFHPDSTQSEIEDQLLSIALCLNPNNQYDKEDWHQSSVTLEPFNDTMIPPDTGQTDTRQLDPGIDNDANGTVHTTIANAMDQTTTPNAPTKPLIKNKWYK